MPQESGKKSVRYEINYFDGVNSTVSSTLSKRSELSHMENARAPVIGVLEKREGQTVKGTAPSGWRFVAQENYGLIKFPTKNTSQQGVFRISASSEPTATLSAEVSDQVYINEPIFSGSFSSPTFSVTASSTDFQTFVVDNITIDDDSPGFFTLLNNNTIKVRNDFRQTNIYYLSDTDTWVKISDSDAQNITGGQFDSCIAEGNLILVNQNSKNRLIQDNGSTVITSTDAGSLYNSSHASKTVFYKGKIYLADFIRDGVRYPTSVVRSSYSSGILALVDGDHAVGVTSIDVTDTKYFYSASGMNTYDVYRGGTLIETITVTGVNETSIAVNATSFAINSSDELWIAGTFNGSKQFRWGNNATKGGRDVKQYDTFKLSGGEEDEITLFDTVGNIIIIGNKYNLATWDDYTLVNMDLNIGCSSKNGSIKLLGSLFFIHYSGIYTTNGGVPKLISRKVARYIQGATKENLEKATAGFKELSVFFAIGDVTLYKEDGSLDKVMTDVCLEYNISDQNWYIHTNISITEFVNYISSDGIEHLLGFRNDSSKSVVDFPKGNTDDGKEIFFRADTQELQTIKEFETFINPLAIITEVQRGSQIKCFVSLDKDDFYELDGTIKKGVTITKINSKDSSKIKPIITRKIKISYRDSSKQRCRISQTALIFLPTLMDEPKE